MSDWIPIPCSGCGATLGASPPKGGPALACCAVCVVQVLAARPTVRKAAPRDIEDELYLPVLAAGGAR